jgi:hypothetical protein
MRVIPSHAAARRPLGRLAAALAGLALGVAQAGPHPALAAQRPAAVPAAHVADAPDGAASAAPAPDAPVPASAVIGPGPGWG